MTTWRERNVVARARRRFTGAEKLMAAGQGWGRCAVGERRQAFDIKFRSLGLGGECPVDEELRKAGLLFGSAVYADAFDDVDLLLDQIEDRVLQLKREAQP